MAAIKNSRDIFLQASTRSVPITFTISNTVKGYGTDIYVINTSSVIILSYTYSLGDTYSSSTLLATTGSSTYNWTTKVEGAYTIWCVAKDSTGNTSTPVSTSLLIVKPGTSILAANIVNNNIVLTWNLSVSDFAVDYYEIRYGNTWEDAAAILVGTTKATTYTIPARYLGSRIWWVAARNIAGTYSIPSSKNLNINKPSAVDINYFKISVVDNNALASWNPPNIGEGNLPIDYYEVKKGPVYDTAVSIGSNGNSSFTSIFESTGGTYTYWLTAVDTAGNLGVSISKSQYINQPPDYVLYNNLDIPSSIMPLTVGTYSNLFITSDNALLGPVATTQLWNTHYSSNNWTTPQNQIDAGYPIYSTPTVTTASYELIIDYVANVPPTIVTSTITSISIIGSVSNICTISYKLLSTDTWIVFPIGTTQLIPTAFRYIRVQYAFTAAAGSNLVKVTNINVKLAIKQRTDSGNWTYDSTKTDAENFRSFGYSFVAADTPIVQSSTVTTVNGVVTPLIPVVIYSGGTNPTGFSVRLYTPSGVATSGAYSWASRGY